MLRVSPHQEKNKTKTFFLAMGTVMTASRSVLPSSMWVPILLVSLSFVLFDCKKGISLSHIRRPGYSSYSRQMQYMSWTIIHVVEKKKKRATVFIKKAHQGSQEKRKKKTNQTKNNAAPGKSASWVIYIAIGLDLCIEQPIRKRVDIKTSSSDCCLIVSSPVCQVRIYT